MTAFAAIILAAGKGTRMKSDKAKVIFELAGKPMIQRVVETAIKINCDKVCVVVGHQKDTVKSVLQGYPNLLFAEQDSQLGTGHAVITTEGIFSDFAGDIIIMAGDVPLLKPETIINLKDHHQRSNADCTVLTAILDDAEKYGRILRNENSEVVGIVEFKDATAEQGKIREINTGIWCFKAEVLYDTLHKINNHNAQNEYYLTDTLSILVEQGRKVEAVVLDDINQASGINSQLQLAELEEAYLRDIKTHWLNNGVMIHYPETVFIGEDVIVEPDVTIEAHTTIKGKSYLGNGSHIGTHSFLENALIGKEAILQGYNIVINARVNETEIIHWSEKILEETLFLHY